MVRTPAPALTSVGFVVVTFDSAATVDGCLDALKRLAPPGAPIVVVDNASTDGTASLVAGRAPRIQLFERERNHGFAAACNLGATHLDAEWIVLVNPDVVLDRLDLNMFTADTAGAGLGLVALGQRSAESRHPTFRVRKFAGVLESAIWFSWTLLVPRGARAERLFWRSRHRDSDNAIAESWRWASGGLVAVRRDAWRQVGGFDERFFLFYEDVDLCRRLLNAGWGIGTTVAITGLHEGGGTTQLRPWKLVWAVTSWLTYVRIWDGRRMARVAAVVLLANLACLFVILLALAPLLRGQDRWHRKVHQICGLTSGLTRALCPTTPAPSSSAGPAPFDSLRRAVS